MDVYRKRNTIRIIIKQDELKPFIEGLDGKFSNMSNHEKFGKMKEQIKEVSKSESERKTTRAERRRAEAKV